MKKTIFALCIAMSIFMCDLMLASAVVCSAAPDGVHHFSGHESLGSLYGVEDGTHEYLYGYDHNEKPIYRNDCKLIQVYRACVFKCAYCNVRESDVQHGHHVYTLHSVDHDKK